MELSKLLEKKEDHEIPDANMTFNQLNMLLTDFYMNLQPVKKITNSVLEKNYNESMEALETIASKYNIKLPTQLDLRYSLIKPEDTPSLVNKVDALYQAFEVLPKADSPLKQQVTYLGRAFLSTMQEYQRARKN